MNKFFIFIKYIFTFSFFCMLIACTSYFPILDLKPIYVDPKSGTWSDKKPSTDDISLALSNSSSYLNLYGRRDHGPDYDYTEPVAFGFTEVFRESGQVSYPVSWYVIFLGPNNIYKNPNLSNPRALSCRFFPSSSGPTIICN